MQMSTYAVAVGYLFWGRKLRNNGILKAKNCWLLFFTAQITPTVILFALKRIIFVIILSRSENQRGFHHCSTADVSAGNKGHFNNNNNNNLPVGFLPRHFRD